MKKAALALASITLLPAVVQAVYAPIPAIEQQNPFTVTLQGGVGYDSNVLSTADKTIGGVNYAATDAAYYTVSPTFKYNGQVLGFASEQSLLGFSYTPEFFQYTDRGVGGDKSLLNHRLSGSVDHAFSENVRLRMDDQFQYIQNPATALSGAPGAGNYQNQGYTLNVFNARLSYDVDARNAVVGKYRNTNYEYSKQPFANGLDRNEQLAGVEYRYKNAADSAIVAEYRIQFVNYNKAVGADSSSNFFLVGYDHEVNTKLSYQSRAGVELRDHDTYGNSTNPYAELSAVYEYGTASSLSGGVYARTAESNSIGTNLNQDSVGIFLNLTHAFTGTLTGSANVGYDFSNLEDNVVADIEEDTFRAGLGLTWAFAERWDAMVTYDYDNVSSDSAVREYDRHRVLLSTRYTFGFGR